MDQGPETLKSALLLQPRGCATAPGLQLHGGSQLTSLPAAVERSSPAPICAPEGAQRGTLQRDEGVSPAISAPAGSYLAFLSFFFPFFSSPHQVHFPELASCLAASVLTKGRAGIGGSVAFCHCQHCFGHIPVTVPEHMERVQLHPPLAERAEGVNGKRRERWAISRFCCLAPVKSF